VTRPRRYILIGISLIAASLLALSVQGGRWWSIGPEVAIGPVATIHCFGSGGGGDGGDDCQRGGLGWTGGSPRWVQSGTAAYAAALIAAFALVALAASLAARRPGRVAAGATAVGTLTALAMGSLFIATFPGVQGAAIDRGIWLFGGGLMVAGIAAITVLRDGRSRGDAAPVTA
jgi:hypothetical protein